MLYFYRIRGRVNLYIFKIHFLKNYQKSFKSLITLNNISTNEVSSNQ